VTFFADLTPHSYVRDSPPALNIGWLDQSRPFATGETSQQFRTRLKEICAKPIYLHRGFHVCQFCLAVNANTPSNQERRGNGQIRVRGTDGTCYAAPTLVAHYVEVHNYKPPQQFVEAVLHGSVAAEELS
jgi:hypothetical protein